MNTNNTANAENMRSAMSVSDETISPPGQPCAASCQSLTSGNDKPQSTVTTVNIAVAWLGEPTNRCRRAGCATTPGEEPNRAGEMSLSIGLISLSIHAGVEQN